MFKKNKVLMEAIYILENNATIRDAAKYFNISKSSLHRHINKDLKMFDYELYLRIKQIFLEHNNTRHINGGLATRKKYASG